MDCNMHQLAWYDGGYNGWPMAIYLGLDFRYTNV